MSVQLDVLIYQRRIRKLLERWEADVDGEFNGAEALLVPVGVMEEESIYQKGVSLQTWLLGYEFPDTILLITKDRLMYTLCSAKKGAILEQLNNFNGSNGFTVETFKRSKSEEENSAALSSFMEKVKSFKKLGYFPKDKYGGKLLPEWNAAFAKVKDSLEQVDVSAGVAAVLAVKDEDEMQLIQTVCKATSQLMKGRYTEEMETFIEEEKSITHEKFAEKIEACIFDEKQKQALKLPVDLNMSFLDWAYTPIIQSGGNYDLKPSAVSDEAFLTKGTIICSLGLRYRNYCSNVSRTFIIDPTKKQGENYNFLLELQSALLAEFKEGVTFKSVYEKASEYVRAKRPDLEKHFLKNIGFVMGLEFRESSLVVGPKTDRKMGEGMTVNLVLGFQNLEDRGITAKSKTYALLLSDLIVVGKEGATLLTDAPRSYNAISYSFDDDEEEEEGKTQVDPSNKSRTTRSAILNTKLRAEARDDDMSAEQKRQQHQKSLLESRRVENVNRFADNAPQEEANSQKFRRFESYKKDTMMPKEIRANKILVDRRNMTLILPVFGVAVPFHINTLKNLSKNEEGEFIYLRFNFNSPGQTVKKDEVLPYDDPSAHFVRSFTFRSTDTWRYNQLYKDIMELKREVQKKEAQRKEMEDLVEQAKLEDTKRPIAILPDVHIRPALEGKRVGGDLQIFKNGIRYHSLKGDQKVEIVYNNIRHCFFQPCDNELYVILHFNLKNPIMVGKRKTTDVQFIREASDMQYDETNNRRRRQNYGDEDELMAEQEERRRRQKLNKEFKLFAEKLKEVSGDMVEADIPLRELGFTGVPSRSSVLLQPTTECLVQLSDPPFMVISLSDIEIAYLERVQFQIKNFDLVLVFKDFKKVPIHINSIPMQQLEAIKDWLDSVDICYIEGPINLNWSNIMKSVQEDPRGFFEEGGWSQFYSDSEEADGGSDEEDSASEYEASDAESSDEDDSSDYSEDEDASEEDDISTEEEESGEDWDELEAKAKRADEEHRRAGKTSAKRADDSDDDRPKKKKR